MKQGTWTRLLTPVVTASGAVMMMPSLLGAGMSPVGVIGGALTFCGAGGGLLLARMQRRAQDRLTQALRESAESAAELRQLRRVVWDESTLSPVVASVNHCIDAASRIADDADADRRRTLVELKLSHAQRHQLESVLSGLEEAVLVTDSFDEAVVLNTAAMELFGLTGGDETTGRPVADLVRVPKLANLIRATRENGIAARRAEEIEWAATNPSEEPRQFRASLTRLVANGHADTASASAGGLVVTVLRDMTRERDLARQKNDFVSSVTHELRTPLAGIRAYVELLLDDDAETEAERREFCEIIESEASRLSDLIDNILNISRIESGLVKLDRKPQSPVLLGEKALGVIEPQAKMKNIEVRRELLPSIYQVVVDGDLLYQVILNLLSNAVKYTPAGGTVTLKCEVDEASGTLTTKVIDSGAGIPADDLARVFEKFYRVERNSKMAKGTGLGLPLVKRVVEQDFGGRVWAESEVDVGSTFAFELPLASTPAQTGRTRAAA